MFKFSKRKTRERCLLISKITLKTSERRSTIVDPYMLFYEKWEIVTEIFDSWKNQMVSIFYFWKNSPKNGQILQLFTLYSKGRHFSITKLDIPIFCNIYYILKLIFEIELKKFLHKPFDKSLVKNTINEISKRWSNIFNSPWFENILPVKFSFPLE